MGFFIGYARSTFFEVRSNSISKAEKDELIEKFVLEIVRQIRKEQKRCGGENSPQKVGRLFEQ